MKSDSKDNSGRAASLDAFRDRMASLEERFGRRFGLMDPPATTFHNYITSSYVPPDSKKHLVFFQCCVRRPFWRSPSHAAMRKAIKAATGLDPRKDFEKCPVHVVVLASRFGPAPYELDDIYPATIRSGGVKHLEFEDYLHAKPVLAGRMADYIASHRSSYNKIAAFAEGLYADVIYEAQRSSGVEFPVFPATEGREIRALKGSPTRTYFQKYWVQLYDEIVGWLGPQERRRAATRLAEYEADIRDL